MSHHSLDTLLGAARRDVLDDEAVARVRVGLTTAGVGVVTVKWWSTIGAKLGAAAFVGALAVGGFLATRTPMRVAVVTPPIPVVVAEVETSSPEPVVAAPMIETAAPMKPVTPPRARAITITTTTAIASAPPAPTQSSAREGLLLLRARSVLATDPQRTLDLVREHASEFPASQLGPERDKLRHEAETKGAR